MKATRERQARISAGRIIAGFIMALDRSLLPLKTYQHVNEQAQGGREFRPSPEQWFPIR